MLLQPVFSKQVPRDGSSPVWRPLRCTLAHKAGQALKCHTARVGSILKRKLATACRKQHLSRRHSVADMVGIKVSRVSTPHLTHVEGRVARSLFFQPIGKGVWDLVELVLLLMAICMLWIPQRHLMSPFSFTRRLWIASASLRMYDLACCLCNCFCVSGQVESPGRHSG